MKYIFIHGLGQKASSWNKIITTMGEPSAALYPELSEMIKDKAIDNCMDVISITDHNSIRSNSIALEYVKNKNIQYISGIEIDYQYKGVNLHLLGYNFDFTKESFYKLKENILNKEKGAGFKRIEKIKEVTKLHLDEGV